MPPLDRSMELPNFPLAHSVREVRRMYSGNEWPPDRIYAMGIIHLAVLGFDLEEELEIEEKVRRDIQEAEREWKVQHGEK